MVQLFALALVAAFAVACSHPKPPASPTGAQPPKPEAICTQTDYKLCPPR